MFMMLVVQAAFIRGSAPHKSGLTPTTRGGEESMTQYKIFLF